MVSGSGVCHPLRGADVQQRGGPDSAFISRCTETVPRCLVRAVPRNTARRLRNDGAGLRVCGSRLVGFVAVQTLAWYLCPVVGVGCGVQGVSDHERNNNALCERCETCGEEEAKYRCPRCMKYSCSLLCVKKHKVALSCSGVRDKTAFVSVTEFTDLNLLSDYRFLEDVGRAADAAARDLSVHRPTTNKYINYLRNRARRHNINLKTLPIGFTKRRENSTIFIKKEQKFYWHLKLVFPHCHAEYTLKRVPEDKTLADILKSYIDPVESDPVICQRLKIYTMSPQSDVQILMKIENRKQNSTRYNELDASRSLLENLKNKVIIEYPTLFVVLKKLKNDMVVLGQEARESAEDLDSGSSSLLSKEEGEIRESALTVL
ncbi:box C/D snoRNA protein 1 [Coturnix japonica]|uniref:box C/D snoRNA protein 1 n=1 Tax=Coturnix japonica TaxID=93934 RepID=UPI0007781029|nr:box C/D snoRNA protein 1 [Coturnix japonica]